MDHRWSHAAIAKYPESFRDTSSLALRIGTLGSAQMSSAACMLMWPQSAAILVREFVCVGGVTDHIHIVTTLFRTVSQAQLVEQIKKASSKWIKALDARYRGFFWSGSCRTAMAFSVSPSQLRVRAGAARAPSHSQLSGGVSRAIALARDRFRRAVCLGLTITRRTDSRFQRCWFLIPLILGRCPRLVVNCAFGAKHPHQAGNSRVYLTSSRLNGSN